MITDEQVDKIIERLISRIEEANVEYLKEIGRTIKQIRTLTPSEAHRLVQILKYGNNYNDIIRKISKYTKLNIKDIDDIFKEFAKEDQAFAKQFYEYKNIPFIEYEDNNALRTQTEVLAGIVKNELYDFTRKNVLGYTIRNLDGTIRFTGLKETYNTLLDTALLNVGQGKETYDSAIRNILKELGTSGLKTIEYESGRAVRLDSATRMYLKSRLMELHNENQKLIGKEIESDGIEISVHGAPAIDHAPVQGRQFSNEEYDKLNNGKIAEDIKGNKYTLDHDGKNGYRPIGELNCYHYIFAIILGINKPEYTDKELQQIIDDNQKGFEFEGKHYTNYEGTQLQRQLERKIRQQKDIQILARESDNQKLIEQSQNNITKLTRKYNELSRVSGLNTKKNRLSVSGYRKVKIRA